MALVALDIGAPPSGGLIDLDISKPPPARNLALEVPVQAYAGTTIDLPQQIGQAMQWMSEPGHWVYEQGKQLADWATKRQEENPDLAPQIEGRGLVGRALSTGARALAPSTVPMIMAAGGAAVGGVPGAAIGLTAGTFGMFGASQAQQTYEKLVDSGVPDDDAKKAAWINLAIEGGGETIGDLAGMKLLGILGKPLAGVLGKAASPVGKAIEGATQAEVPWLVPYLKQLPKTIAIESGTEFGQNFGEAWVENKYGAKNPEQNVPFQQGVQGAEAALGMTALLTPFGLAGFARAARRQGTLNSRVSEALQDPNAPLHDRIAASKIVFGAIKDISPEAAQAWSENSSYAITANAPILIDERTAAPGLYWGGPGQPATLHERHALDAEQRIAEIDKATTIDEAIKTAAAAVETVDVGALTKDEIRMAQDGRMLLEAMERKAQEDALFAEQERQRLEDLTTDQQIAAHSDETGTPTAMQVAFERAGLSRRVIGGQNAIQEQGTGAGGVQRGAGPGNEIQGEGVGIGNGPEGAPGARTETQEAQPGVNRAPPTVIPHTAAEAQAATTEHLQAAANLTRSEETRGIIGEELARRENAQAAGLPATVQEALQPTAKEAPQAAQPAAPPASTTLVPVAQPASAAAALPAVQQQLFVERGSQRFPVASVEERRAANQRIQAERKAAPKPVETFAGKYGNGMNEVPARQQQRRLTAERPELDWRVEPSHGLAYPRVINGYAKNPEARSSMPVAESQAPATSEPGNAGVAPGQVAALPEITATDLRRLAGEAGWEERGGKIIREGETGGIVGTGGAVVGRTKWIPKREWFQRMRQDLGNKGLSGEREIQAAVDHYLAGKKLTVSARRTVDWMLAEIKSERDQFLKEHDAQVEAVGDITPEDLLTVDLQPSGDLEAIADLMASAVGIDEAATERAAIQFEGDDFGLISELKRIIHEQRTTQPQSEAASAGQIGSREAPGSTEVAPEPILSQPTPADLKARAAATALGMEKGNTFPYPTAGEMTSIRAAFDNFFQTIETRETDKGVAMYSQPALGGQTGLGSFTNDPSPEESGKVQSGIEGKSAREAALFIAKNAPSRDYRLIAYRVARQLQRLETAGMRFDLKVAHLGQPVHAELAGKMRGMTWRAYESPTTDIWVQGADVTGLVGVSYETVLHELLHAVTQSAIYAGRQPGNTALQRDISDLLRVHTAIAQHFNSRIDAVGRDINKLDSPIEKIVAQGHNALRDPGELISWALTNRAMQDYLEGIPYKGGTLWSRFVVAIRKLLRLSPRADTALSETLRITDRLLDAWGPALMSLKAPTQINYTGGLLNSTEDTGVISRGMPLADLHAAVSDALANLDVGSSIYATVADARAATGVDVPADARGMFQGGKLHLIAENLSGPLDAQFALWHEVLHAGLARMYGVRSKAYEQALTSIAGRNQNVRTAAATWRANFGEDARKMATDAGMTEEQAKRYVSLQSYEEALADLSGRNATISGLAQFLAAVQKFMRSVGLDGIADWMEDATDAEALSMVLKAREALTAGEQGDLVEQPAFAREPGPAPEFSRSTLALDPEDRPLLRGAGLSFVAPQKFADRNGIQVYNYGIEKDGQIVGDVSLGWKNGRFEQLLWLGIQEQYRRQGLARDVVQAVVDHNGQDHELYISTILKRAEPFWRSIGADFVETEVGHDGFLTQKRFYAARGESGPAGGAEARPGSEAGQGRGQGESRPEGAGQRAEGPALSLDFTKPGSIPRFSRIDTMAGNPDQLTRFQQVPKVANFIANVFKSPSPLGVLNWVHSPFHKAEVLARKGMPGYKLVFQRLQSYVNDISGFAVKSEQLAPQIFRELKGVMPKDFSTYFKGAASEKDIAAIGPWLNHGTLYGGGSPLQGVVWTDDELRGKFSPKRANPRLTPLTDAQIPLYHQARAAIDQSLETSGKAVIYRHVAKYGITFDRDMSLADVSQVVRDKLTELMADKQLEIDHETETADTTFSRAEELKAKADADRTNREARIAADIAKDAYEKAQTRLNKLQGEMDAMKALAGDSNEEIARKEASNSKMLQKGTIRGIEEHAQGLIEHGYMPLKRFGNKTVTAIDKDGKVQFFGTYDGTPLVPGSANAEMRRVATEVKALHPEWKVIEGTRSERAWKMYQGLSLDALENFLDFLDPETKAELERDKTIQEYLKNAVNDRSVLKQLIHRKGTPGFSTDVPRILASFITQSARNASGLYHIAEAKRLVAEMTPANGEQGAVQDEAADMVDYVTKPGEEAAKLRSFLFFNFLGGSVASAAINLTQTVMMTAPYLAQYSGVKNLTTTLVRAAKMAVGDPAAMEGSLGRDLQRAELEGVTAPQQIYHLTAMASNNPFSSDRKFRTAMAVWNGMFGAAEVFNRRTAFIAAHDVFNSMAPAARDATGFDTAYDFAKDAVDQTQLVYSKVNRPNFGRGPVGATILTFKQFTIGYLELLSRLPPKQQLMMLGILMLMAGAEGLPFAEDLEDAIDTLGQWLGFSTNTGKWTGKKIRDTLGNEFERPILKGLGGMLPIDLHSRLGMPNLLPGTAFFKPSEIDKTRDVAEAVGPLGSVMQSLSQALQLMARGKWDQAAVLAAPKAARDAYNGFHMAATGESQDTRGRLAMRDVTIGEALGKGIGFNPQRAAIESEAKREQTLDKNLRIVRMDDIASDWADGILRRDPEKIKDAIARYKEWNRDNPPAMRIDSTQMAHSVRERVIAARMTSAQRFEKSVPKAMKSEAREALRQ